MLANDINFDNKELLENIIEGIPALGLRDQARIQCFAEPVQILKAFSGIRIPERKQEINSSLTSTAAECFCLMISQSEMTALRNRFFHYGRVEKYVCLLPLDHFFWPSKILGFCYLHRAKLANIY